MMEIIKEQRKIMLSFNGCNLYAEHYLAAAVVRTNNCSSLDIGTDAKESLFISDICPTTIQSNCPEVHFYMNYS